MRSFWGLTFLSASFLASHSLVFGDTPAPTCPDASLMETAEDCPWASIAREVQAVGGEAQPLLQKRAPQVMAQIQSDAKIPALKTLWGQSINFDEFANGVIVAPPILGALAQSFGLAAPEGQIVHAGLEHTYGYLFSTLKTSFGYKRARWVQGTIEEGLGIPKGLLGPTPKNGTLLTNATQLLGRIAFAKNSPERKALDGFLVVPSIAKAAAKSRAVRTLVEVIAERNTVLRTDLVPFDQIPPGQRNSHLLVYSVRYLNESRTELVTAFPVESSFVDQMFKPERLGKDRTDLITRYNAQVDGVTGSTWHGSRLELGHE